MKTKNYHLGRRAGKPAIYDQDGMEIAEMLEALNVDWREDAKLICAAPDLLRACVEALQVLRDPDSEDYFDYHRLESALENAILKAGGEA